MQQLFIKLVDVVQRWHESGYGTTEAPTHAEVENLLHEVAKFVVPDGLRIAPSDE